MGIPEPTLNKEVRKVEFAIIIKRLRRLRKSVPDAADDRRASSAGAGAERKNSSGAGAFGRVGRAQKDQRSCRYWMYGVRA
jgi:hypothetical protein